VSCCGECVTVLLVYLTLSLCIIKHRTKETWENMLNVALGRIRRRLHSAASLSPGNEPLYALDKKLDGSQCQLKRGGEEEFHCLSREPKSCCLAHSQVAILIQLPRCDCVMLLGSNIPKLILRLTAVTCNYFHCFN
jgi:hypothetical protein